MLTGGLAAKHFQTGFLDVFNLAFVFHNLHHAAKAVVLPHIIQPLLVFFPREEYEKRLDDMWQNYCLGCMMQVVEYKGQVKYIKEAGLEVLRSKSTGKHKIVYKKGR